MVIVLNLYRYFQSHKHAHFDRVIIWQLVLASSIGHCQAIIQERECVQKLITIR